ncbi:hypothetical protein HDU78_007591 [Chytriomyces hyalinus]|nr:hypothetical protein HDU78_007591 [Chytriomyces hyalinus]
MQKRAPMKGVGRGISLRHSLNPPPRSGLEEENAVRHRNPKIREQDPDPSRHNHGNTSNSTPIQTSKPAIFSPFKHSTSPTRQLHSPTKAHAHPHSPSHPPHDEVPTHELIAETGFFAGAIHFMCPFPLCASDPMAILEDPYAAISHLRTDHALCVCRVKQAMPYLDWYLQKWGATVADELEAVMAGEADAADMEMQEASNIEFDDIEAFDKLDINDEMDMSNKSESAARNSEILRVVYDRLGLVAATSCSLADSTSMQSPSSTDPGQISYHLGAAGFERDLEIRKVMHKNKLNEILAIQTTAIAHPPPPRKCIFCKLTPESHSSLFIHMRTEHGFHIGSPLNLAYVDEFLTVLERKMGVEGKCIYCEGVFPDTVVLRKHMRKKKHFRVNPWNLNYDRFYVLNYADFEGRRWRDLELEQREWGHPELDDYTPEDESHGVINASSQYQGQARNEADDWDLDMDNEEESTTTCPFDKLRFPTLEKIVLHLKEVHGLDLGAITKEYDMDTKRILWLIRCICPSPGIDSLFGDMRRHTPTGRGADDDDSDGNDDEDWEGWTGEGQDTMCLFDDVMLGSVEDAVSHLKEAHGFNLRTIKKEFDLDAYGIIRLINYIRSCTSTQSCFGCRKSFETMEELTHHYDSSQHHLSMVPAKGDPFWSQVEHLFPSYDEDPLLTWDLPHAQKRREIRQGHMRPPHQLDPEDASRDVAGEPAGLNKAGNKGGSSNALYSSLLARIRAHIHPEPADGSNTDAGHVGQAVARPHSQNNSSNGTHYLDSVSRISSLLDTLGGIDALLRLFVSLAWTAAGTSLVLARVEDEEDSVWAMPTQVQATASFGRWFRLENTVLGWWRVWCWWGHASAAAALLADSSMPAASGSTSNVTGTAHPRMPFKSRFARDWIALSASGFGRGDLRRKLALRFLRLVVLAANARDVVRLVIGVRCYLDNLIHSLKQKTSLSMYPESDELHSLVVKNEETSPPEIPPSVLSSGHNSNEINSPTDGFAFESIPTMAIGSPSTVPISLMHSRMQSFSSSFAMPSNKTTGPVSVLSSYSVSPGISSPNPSSNIPNRIPHQSELAREISKQNDIVQEKQETLSSLPVKQTTASETSAAESLLTQKKHRKKRRGGGGRRGRNHDSGKQKRRAQDGNANKRHLTDVEDGGTNTNLSERNRRDSETKRGWRSDVDSRSFYSGDELCLGDNVEKSSTDSCGDVSADDGLEREDGQSWGTCRLPHSQASQRQKRKNGAETVRESNLIGASDTQGSSEQSGTQSNDLHARARADFEHEVLRKNERLRKRSSLNHRRSRSLGSNGVSVVPNQTSTDSLVLIGGDDATTFSTHTKLSDSLPGLMGSSAENASAKSLNRRASMIAMSLHDSAASFGSSQSAHKKPISLAMSRTTTPPSKSPKSASNTPHSRSATLGATKNPTTNGASKSSNDGDDRFSRVLTAWRNILHILHVSFHLTYFLARNRVIGFSPPAKISTQFTKATYSLKRTRDIRRWMCFIWILAITVDASIWTRKAWKLIKGLIVVRRQIALLQRGSVPTTTCVESLSEKSTIGLDAYRFEDFIGDIASKGFKESVLDLMRDLRQQAAILYNTRSARSFCFRDPASYTGMPFQQGAPATAASSLEHKMLLDEIMSLKRDMRTAWLAMICILGDVPLVLAGLCGTEVSLVVKKLLQGKNDSLRAVVDESGCLPLWFVGFSAAMGSVAGWKLRWTQEAAIDTL